MTEDADCGNPKPPSVDRLSKLWHRINDHKMVQWSAAYVAVAYAIQHGVTLTSEAFEWPHAVVRVSMLLLVLGLPLIMTLAWYHGARASRGISGPELTIISILLVIVSLLFFVFVQPSEEVAAGPKPAAQQASVAAVRVASVPLGGISIAVLPFVNLSSDKEQEFFSDGMTEEITSALAKVKGLNVVARTSAFEFKGQNKDVRAIGQALSATHLIEGSVRKDGNEVRITAQLIKADDGTHLWTESYNRELKDIFATQSDIAEAIAGALRVPLGLKQGDTLVSNRTNDLDSYQQYLRARALVRARGLKPVTDAIGLLEQVVARDPDYAPAWALLAQAYDLTPQYYRRGLNSASVEEERRVADASLPKAESAARRAIALDRNLADGYLSLGLAQYVRGKLLLGEDLFKKAPILDPNHPDSLHLYGDLQAAVGRLKEALETKQHLRAVEPFVPQFNQNAALVLWLNGQNDAAISILKGLPADRGGPLAQVYASIGLYIEAADTLLRIPSGVFAPGTTEEAARLLRTAQVSVALPQSLPPLPGLGFVYLYVGAPDRLVDTYENGIEAGYFVNTGVFWHPSYAPVRKTDRFKAYVRKAGLVEYWRARGWPDLCHHVGTDDFVCD